VSGGVTPARYVRERIGRADVVALAAVMPSLRTVLRASRNATLHDYAARHPEAEALAGRGVAYAVPLPDDGPRVVVRHARHGGALAAVTGDLFLFPRAARELDIAVRLAALGVPTPELVAYVLYPAGVFRRSDVATREIDRARDLAAAIMSRPEPGPRKLLIEAASKLIAQLGRAGVRHPDLNLKNILLAPGPTSRLRAWVLDVDRVLFGRRGDPRVTEANLARLERSARKWRDEHGAPVSEDDLAAIRGAVWREFRGAEPAAV
jgi:3-deoxy-D-manno-octulosonic acid kinase